MRLSFCLLFVPVLLGACSTAKRNPIGFWSSRRYDKELRQHGPWPTYDDDAKKRPMALGRYTGRWRYYSPTGKLERTEQFARRPYGLITLTEYQAGGKKKRQGQARIVNEPSEIHFYWFGDWQVFDAQGRQTAVEYYENGVLRSTQLIKVKLASY